jgi:hypothetical protein
MSSAQIVSASVLHNKNAPPSSNYNEHYSSPHPGHPLPALPSSQVSCNSGQNETSIIFPLHLAYQCQLLEKGRGIHWGLFHTLTSIFFQYWGNQVTQPGTTPTSFGGLPTTHTRTLFGGSPGPSSALVPSNNVSSPNEEMVSIT